MNLAAASRTQGAGGEPDKPAAANIPRTMTAMRLVAPGRFEPARVATPEPAEGELLVRIEGCGVCGSNLPVWEGRPWFEYPLAPGAPGHEAWGRVVAAGPGTDDSRVGERVAVLSQRGFAEFDTVSADMAATIPRGLEGTPVPGEPLACAMNVMARSGVTHTTTVCVVGVGFLGAAIVQLARRAGARVFACSRRGFSRDLATSLGAEDTSGLDEVGRLAESIRRSTGDLCDVVIEAGGVQETLDAASPLVRERGRLVLAGFHQDGPRRVDMQAWNWNGIDVINAHERDEAVYARGMRRAIAAMKSGTYDPSPLFTHTYPLERLDDAMAALRDRPDGFVKALVNCGDHR